MNARARRAFTLLEVLLALGLVGIIALTAIDLASDLLRDRHRLDHACLALRSADILFERIEQHSQCAIAGGRGIGPGVRGSEHELVLLARRVSPPQLSPHRQPQDPLGDLQQLHVRYEPETTTLRLRVEHASDTAVQSPFEILSQRVEGLRFRYHDGSGWRNSFDSQQSGSMPVAIEISIWLMLRPRPEPAPTALPHAGDFRAPPDTEAALMDEPPLPDAARSDDTDPELLDRPQRAPDRIRIIAIPDARPHASAPGAQP